MLAEPFQNSSRFAKQDFSLQKPEKSTQISLTVFFFQETKHRWSKSGVSTEENVGRGRTQ